MTLTHTLFIQPLSQGKGINQIIPDYCEPVGSNLPPQASLNSNTNRPQYAVCTEIECRLIIALKKSLFCQIFYTE